VIEGRARVATTIARDGWGRTASLEGAAGLTLEARARLANAWARDAALEHASVASFARFSLELLSVGAPSDLVEMAARAMIDETEHARLCYALASRFAGRMLGPDRIDLAGAATSASLSDIVYATVRDGCVGETIAAMIAEAALERTTDPEARRALEIIAADEARHAELAYRFVAFAVGAGDASVTLAVRRGFDDALARIDRPAEPGDAIDAALEAFGRASPGLVRESIDRSVRDIVLPARALLLAST
jgi:hypothetical protein